MLSCWQQSRINDPYGVAVSTFSIYNLGLKQTDSDQLGHKNTFLTDTLIDLPAMRAIRKVLFSRHAVCSSASTHFLGSLYFTKKRLLFFYIFVYFLYISTG